MIIINDLTELKSYLFNSGIRYSTITQDLFPCTFPTDRHFGGAKFVVTIERFDEEIKEKITKIFNSLENVKFQLIDHY